MIKRLFDFTASLIGLIVFSPIILVFLLLVFLQDFKSPFYVAPRMRTPDSKFRMVKIRSMVSNADKIGGTSTSNTDRRITWVGQVIRKFKIDEITQLYNVLLGQMSLVGPRPQTLQDARLYSDEENRLFDARPGITDLSSIVFADEGSILAGSEDPDLKYNQVIRPWKSRLGLLYVEKQNVLLDIRIICTTLMGIVSREAALRSVVSMLRGLGAEEQLIEVAARETELVPFPPPGMDAVETRT